MKIKCRKETDMANSRNILELQTSIRHIQEIIRNTLISVQKYKDYEIFSNTDINVCITSLHDLYKKSHILYEKTHIPLNVSPAPKEFIEIKDKLAIIISRFGTIHLTDLLFVQFGHEYSTCEIKNKYLKDKVDIIYRYLHPIGYKITTNKNKKNYKKGDDIYDDFFCKNKITDEIIVIDNSPNFECYEIENDFNVKSFYLKIHGIRVVIQHEKLQKTLVINCIVDDIILDFFSNEYVKMRHKSILDNVPDSYVYDINIINRIVSCMTLKDILIYGNSDIYKKYISIISDVNFIKNNKIEFVMNKFLEMDITMQRNMLINLLIYNKEDDIHYITYLLYDLITVNNNETLDSNEQKIIYNSLPYKIQNYFKDTMNITIKYSQDIISKYDITRISLEQQIHLLKAPENVKEKAIMKFKEIKGKTDESSAKTKQYLEGLLKIPFGIYKQEPILKVMKEINKSFIDIMNKHALLNKKFIYPQKPYYTKIEIIQILDNVNTYIHEEFISEFKNRIIHASIKQITNVILGINTLQKNKIIDIHTHLENLNKLKTKHQKVTEINNIIETIYSNSQCKNELTVHLYAIYEMLQSNSPVNYTPSSSKIPIEIKNINKNIKEISQSLENITNILDDSIYGHTHAKNQILKIFGQWMSGEQSGYCFGFEGSPGVGKTSLAKKGLANCLKDENGLSRPFAFIALGGSCNGSTLEGHSFTYVNSTWGRIVDILMETKCMNPIIYIDELDKVSKTEHGKEIIGILTHLIDTTQNDVFQDKYFSGINIDLSKALFIFSYNDPEQIDKVLLDRIHRVKFDNLSLDEKIVIVEKYVLPEINKKMGFSDVVILSKEIIEFIVESYTLEPGIRKLKEVLFDLFGEINIDILKRNDKTLELPLIITKEHLETKYLKKYQKIEEKKRNTENKVGIINGLWANSLGKGGIIQIESVFFPSSVFLEMRLTGLQGDVMKESMNVAKTLAWNLTDETKKKELIHTFESTKCQGLHVHCPEGAISKDGPSAGTAITCAIYSLFNGKKIKSNIAITGEINLQGDVTSIGGLETKIIGGIKSGINMFLYPESNSSDFHKFKEKAIFNDTCKGIHFIAVKHIQEVFQLIFE
jgi:ATP-dependent Lon protease